MRRFHLCCCYGLRRFTDVGGTRQNKDQGQECPAHNHDLHKSASSNILSSVATQQPESVLNAKPLNPNSASSQLQHLHQGSETRYALDKTLHSIVRCAVSCSTRALGLGLRLRRSIITPRTPIPLINIDQRMISYPKPDPNPADRAKQSPESSASLYSAEHC